MLPWIYIVRKNSSSNWLKSLVHAVDCAVLLNITCIRWYQGLLQPNEAWNATHGNAQQGLAKYPWGRHSTWKPLSSVFPHRAGSVVLPLLPDISFFPLPALEVQALMVQMSSLTSQYISVIWNVEKTWILRYQNVENITLYLHTSSCQIFLTFFLERILNYRVRKIHVVKAYTSTSNLVTN